MEAAKHMAYLGDRKNMASLRCASEGEGQEMGLGLASAGPLQCGLESSSVWSRHCALTKGAYAGT